MHRAGEGGEKKKSDEEAFKFPNFHKQHLHSIRASTSQYKYKTNTANFLKHIPRSLAMGIQVSFLQFTVATNEDAYLRNNEFRIQQSICLLSNTGIPVLCSVLWNPNEQSQLQGFGNRTLSNIFPLKSLSPTLLYK